MDVAIRILMSAAVAVSILTVLAVVFVGVSNGLWLVFSWLAVLVAIGIRKTVRASQGGRS